ncbi:MAG: hypothetical protein AAB864_00090 [Patescibacteria group bacterium]
MPASIEDIHRLYLQARGHYLYKKHPEEKPIQKIEAFLLQTVVLEGILTNYGLLLLKDRPDLKALLGKRNSRYGYDNAINDLYFLGVISTTEFQQLDTLKNKRNEFIHNLLSNDLKTTSKNAGLYYQKSDKLVSQLLEGLNKKLKS